MSFGFAIARFLPAPAFYPRPSFRTPAGPRRPGGGGGVLVLVGCFWGGGGGVGVCWWVWVGPWCELVVSREFTSHMSPRYRLPSQAFHFILRPVSICAFNWPFPSRLAAVTYTVFTFESPDDSVCRCLCVSPVICSPSSFLCSWMTRPPLDPLSLIFPSDFDARRRGSQPSVSPRRNGGPQLPPIEFRPPPRQKLACFFHGSYYP